MKHIFIILLKAISYFGLLCAVIVMLLVGTFFSLNNTNQISSLSRDFLNRNIAGSIYFENLHLEFRQFPIVEVRADNGHLISALNNNPTDTLARFKHLNVEIDVMRLFDDSLSIVIPKVSLTDGFALVTISEDGIPGWNVWRFKPPRPKGAKRKNRERLYISSVNLRGKNHFVYHNYKRKRSMDIVGGDLDFYGSIRIRNKEIYVSDFVAKDVDAKFSLSNGKSVINFCSQKIALSSVPKDSLRVYNIKAVTSNSFLKLFGNTLLHGSDTVTFNATAGFDFLKGIYQSNGINLNFNNHTSISAIGNYNTHSNKIDLRIAISLFDILFSLEDFGIKSSKTLRKNLHNVSATIEADIDGNLNFKNKVYPPLSLNIASSGGEYNLGKLGKLYNIDFRAKSNIDIRNTDSLFVDITRLNANYKHSILKSSGTVSGTQPSLIADLNVDAQIHLADISNHIIDNLNLRGFLVTKANLKAPISKGFKLNNSKILLNDTIYIKNLAFNIPHTVASVYAHDAAIRINQNQSKEFSSVSLNLNEVYLKSIAEIDATINQVIGAADIYQNSNMIFPRLDKGSLNFYKTQAITSSGDTLRLKKFISMFSSESMRGNDPFVKYFAILDNLSFISPDSTCIHVNDIGVMSNAKMYESADFRNNKLKLWDAIGTWIFDGNLTLSNAQLIMPRFPLYSQIIDFEVLFNERNAVLNNLQMKIGDSEISLNGKANNWHNYILSDSLLDVFANINAHNIDLNQLIPAIINGAAYTQSLRIPSKKTTIKSNSFATVPPNINAKLNINAINAVYGEAILDTASTQIVMSDNLLKINDFKFRSNIINANLDFSYFTPASSYADICLDFEIKNLNAPQTIQLIPKITSTMPFLSTFDGRFNANVNAKWRIDSTMSINSNSLTSSVAIDGHDLSIMKKKIMPRFLGWLFFGNQQRLKIDSIGIRANIENNRLTLAPMSFNLGKYRFGAHGVMKTDNLYYHLALLKSPIGLKLGFDIYGNPNKLKFRLTSVKGMSLEKMRVLLNSPVNSFIINLPNKYNLKAKENRVIVNSKYSHSYDSIKDYITNSKPMSIERIELLKLQMIEKIKTLTGEIKD